MWRVVKLAGTFLNIKLFVLNNSWAENAKVVSHIMIILRYFVVWMMLLRKLFKNMLKMIKQL